MQLVERKVQQIGINGGSGMLMRPATVFHLAERESENVDELPLLTFWKPHAALLSFILRSVFAVLISDSSASPDQRHGAISAP
jgi:hypothetical protein